MKVTEIILEIKFIKYLVIFRHRKRLHIGKFERKHEIFLLKWIKHIRLKKHFLRIWYIQSTGQGGLACCSPWGHKESDTTEQLNWAELASPVVIIMIDKVQSFNLTEGKSYWQIIQNKMNNLCTVEVLKFERLNLAVEWEFIGTR